MQYNKREYNSKHGDKDNQVRICTCIAIIGENHKLLIVIICQLCISGPVVAGVVGKKMPLHSLTEDIEDLGPDQYD